MLQLNFRSEIAEMEAEERSAKELEECYYSDEEDLVVNKIKRKVRVILAHFRLS